MFLFGIHQKDKEMQIEIPVFGVIPTAMSIVITALTISENYDLRGNNNKQKS